MASPEPLTDLRQLPRDVLLNIVGRCGPREKWALFKTGHFGRLLIVEAVQQINVWMHLSQLPRERRPPLLMQGPDGSWLESVQLQLDDVSLSGLMQRVDQLRGIKHLKLVRGLFTSVHAPHNPVSCSSVAVRTAWCACTTAGNVQSRHVHSDQLWLL
jgi:hypothetical protein